MSSSAALVGSTGLVGSAILSTLAATSSISSIHAFSRKDLPSTSPKLQTIVAKDSSTWSSQYPVSTPIFFSALGTTRGQAGSFEKQRAIDHDLNVSLAKAAKEAGAQTYVLVSSSGANASSRIPYMKLKGDVEESIKALGFAHTVILRPGLLRGTRADSRPPEYLMRLVASGLAALSPKLTDFWAQEVEVIARASVTAALRCQEGKVQEKVWLLDQADIVRMGRTEWMGDGA